jgi:hypothetical protein
MPTGVALFAGSTYYPGGGAEDYVDRFDHFHEAEAVIPALEFAHGIRVDWAHVFDLRSKRILGRWRRAHWADAEPDGTWLRDDDSVCGVG